MHDAYQEATVQHGLAAHAHRAAAEDDAKRDRAAGSWHSERALKRRMMLGLLVVANFAALPMLAQAQSPPDSGELPSNCCQHTPGATGPGVHASVAENQDL